MPYYNQQQNQQQKPDLHELLGLMQFLSPAAQQERQAQLQEVQARTGLLQDQLHQQQQSGPLNLQELQARIAAQSAIQQHEAAGTTAENTRNTMEQNIVGNQAQQFSDAHLKNQDDMAEVVARTSLINKRDVDPGKILMHAQVMSSAMKDPMLLAALRHDDPDSAGLVDNMLNGQKTAATQMAWDAQRTKNPSLPQSPPTSFDPTKPFTQPDPTAPTLTGDPGFDSGQAIAHLLGKIPSPGIAPDPNVPVTHPILNFINGLMGTKPIPPDRNLLATLGIQQTAGATGNW